MTDCVGGDYIIEKMIELVEPIKKKGWIGETIETRQTNLEELLCVAFEFYGPTLSPIESRRVQSRE